MNTFDWADDIDDHEYPEPDDSDDDQTETISCPECGQAVYEDAIACHGCGHYLTSDSVTRQLRPRWWLWAVVAAVLSVLFLQLL